MSDTRLTPPQAEILSCGVLTSGFNCILQMPTGSGKTWLAEQTISHILSNGGRVIYLTPLRALAAELLKKWQNNFARDQVGVFTGDYGIPGNPYPVSFREARLMIMTPERLDACTRNWRCHWSWLPEVDLVIVDEFHLLGDKQRGARLEGTLSRMRRLNPFLCIHGLSATLGNRTELANWLDAVEFSSDWRPIPIRWNVVRYRKATEKPALLIGEVSRNIKQQGKSLVFVQSRRRAEELSRQLVETGVRACHHHAGLTHSQRNKVERGFRGNDCDVLVATSTLEMGLNLPVRQVILYDLQFFDGVDFCPLPVNAVWQRAGRAGRPGLDSEGEVVLIAAKWDSNANKYQDGKFEPILSGISHSRYLAEQIVVEISGGLARNAPQLQRIFKRSLAAHQRNLPEIEKTIEEMRLAGLIKEEIDENSEKSCIRLKTTRLGRIAVRHLLSPSTILLFRNALEGRQDYTFFDLLIIACATQDCEPVLTVDFEELDCLIAKLQEENSLLLSFDRPQIVKQLGIDGKRLLAAFKMALVARDWTRLADADQVAEKNDCYAFEVQRLCESLSRLLLAMTSILPDNMDEVPEWLQEEVLVPEKIAVLQKMVAMGLNETVVTLTVINGIGAKLAKKLCAVGIEDVEDLALAEPEDIAKAPGISQKRAQKWISEAEETVHSKFAHRYQEEDAKADLGFRQWPEGVEPYRLRRALELKISGTAGGIYRVTGGLEPHIVRFQEKQLKCDCADFEKGHTCKHLLAVMLYRGDRELKKLSRMLDAVGTDTKLNLFDLWWGRNATGSKRRYR